MGITNFDLVAVMGGVPLMPGGLPLGANYFFVDSATGSDGNPGTWEDPFATLDFAIGQCTANKGDVIVVKPNHSETITGAGGITADVAGITIVGLGQGDQRPRFLMDGATTVTFVVSAADVTVRNCVFAAGHADIVTCFNITGKNAWIDSCEFVENVATENFLTEIKATSTTNNNADGLKVTNCRAITVDASALEFLEVNADLDRLVFTGNFISKDGATGGVGILCATGKDLTSAQITHNQVLSGATSGAILVNSDTSANTGIVAYNVIGHHDTASAAPIDLTGARIFENYAVGVDDASGLLLPAVDDNA